MNLKGKVHEGVKRIQMFKTALFWVIPQRMVVIPYRRFGTTYRFRLSKVKNPRSNRTDASESW